MRRVCCLCSPHYIFPLLRGIQSKDHWAPCQGTMPKGPQTMWHSFGHSIAGRTSCSTQPPMDSSSGVHCLPATPSGQAVFVWSNCCLSRNTYIYIYIVIIQYLYSIYIATHTQRQSPKSYCALARPRVLARKLRSLRWLGWQLVAFGMCLIHWNTGARHWHVPSGGSWRSNFLQFPVGVHVG